jgi:hypothetical protein
VLASVQTYASPELELSHKCPTAGGLEVIDGSEALTVASVEAAIVDTRPVRLAPLIAGSVPVIFAAGIAVKLAALPSRAKNVDVEPGKVIVRAVLDTGAHNVTVAVPVALGCILISLIYSSPIHFLM